VGRILAGADSWRNGATTGGGGIGPPALEAILPRGGRLGLIRAGDVAWVNAGPWPGFTGSGTTRTARQVPRIGSGILARMNVRGANGATAGGGGIGPPGLEPIRPRGGSVTLMRAGWEACRKTGPLPGL